MAYNVLSRPSLKNNYDSMSQEQRRDFDFFRSQPPPEETFRSVLLGALNEFLDGDLEVVRNFLSGCLLSPISSVGLSDCTKGATSTLNSSLKLGEEGIESVLMTLHSIRQRALSKGLRCSTESADSL